MTLDQLRAESGLTPESFMRHFFGFQIRVGPGRCGKPETFLKNQAGDCDDFATCSGGSFCMKKGYTTRLVVIYMAHDVHVVCYVAETNSYLDYNLRKKNLPAS